MNEQATNEFARTFLSVIAGVITAIAVGALHCYWEGFQNLNNKI